MPKRFKILQTAIKGTTVRYGFVTVRHDLYIGDSHERASKIKEEVGLESTSIYCKNSDKELLSFFNGMNENRGVKGEKITIADANVFTGSS